MRPPGAREGHVSSLDWTYPERLAAWRRARRLSRRADPHAFHAFLETLEPTVLILLAGIIRRWPQEPAAAGRRERPTTREALLQALRDREASDDQIIEYVLALQLDYRARYNLACYYAGRGDAGKREAYEKALSELKAARKEAPGDLLKWAKEDPSLAGLRDDEELGPQFAAVVGAVTEPTLVTEPEEQREDPSLAELLAEPASTAEREERRPALALLRNVPAFKALEEPQLEEVAGQMTEREFRPGDTLVSEGDEVTEVFVIEDGSVRESGGETERTLARGDYFGEELLGRPSPVTIRAETDGRSWKADVAPVADSPSIAQFKEMVPAIALLALWALTRLQRST
jgi:Cyclic nucleotide-binding domain